jgi:nitrate reductase gamma subunit
MTINFPFSAWPYISLSLLLVGILVRYLQSRKQMAALSAEIAEAKDVFGGSKLWRASLVLLLAGHIGGLLFPRAVQTWNSNVARLYILESVAFAVGLVALACWLVILWRHLGHSTRSALVELSDTIFLTLLFVGLLSGLLMAILYRWASSWATITLSPYLLSLLRVRPASQLVTEMPLLVRIHVFSAFAAIAVLPLTRLAAVIVPAVHWSLRLVARPAEALGQAVAARLRKHNPAEWLWPEED